MTAAIVDDPRNEHAPAWWFLDLLVIEHRCAPGMQTVVLEMTLPVGSSAPLHVHDSLDDTWYVLDGEMVVRCGDETRVVGAGHWVSMPRGVPHTFRVVGDRPARILLVHDNATFRDLIRELRDLLTKIGFVLSVPGSTVGVSIRIIELRTHS